MNINKVLSFALGPIASALFGMFSLVIMAWAFSPEDVGRMNLLQVVLSLSLLTAVLGLDQAYVREYHGCKDHPALLNACFSPGFAIMLVFTLGILPFGQPLTLWLFGVSDHLLYVLILLCIALNYVSRFLSLILRMQERGLAFSMSQLIPKVLQLALLGAVIWFGVQRNFLTLLSIALISMLTVTLIYAWNTYEQWRPALRARPSVIYFQLLLKFGAPLVLSGLSYWGLTATSSLMLRSESNLGQLGIYSVTTSFAGVAYIFQSVFSVVWAPTVYKWVNEGVDMARVDGVARLVLAAVCGIWVLVGCFSWLTDFVLPLHYINVKYLVVCAIIPPMLYTLSEITCVGIGITRSTMLTVWVTLTALICNVILNLWLVPTQGAGGAVISNAISYFVFFVGRTEASAKVWRKFPRSRLYIHVMVLLVPAIALVELGPTLPFHYSFIWLLMLSVLIFSFERELIDMLKYGKAMFNKER
jgi:O-antigen/teichoic acid export membrane protein